MNDTEIVRIPSERVNTVLGRGGSTKKRIERKCNVELEVDSDGSIQITGNSSEVFFAKDVVKAIGRGFRADIALRLLDNEYVLYIISLKEVVGSDKAITRVKGRVIGEEGSIKGQIEHATDSYICVHGNTITIIARIDTMEHVKEAIGMLVNGARHSSVLKYLGKVRREIYQQRLRNRI